LRQRSMGERTSRAASLSRRGELACVVVFHQSPSFFFFSIRAWIKAATIQVLRFVTNATADKRPAALSCYLLQRWQFRRRIDLYNPASNAPNSRSISHCCLRSSAGLEEKRGASSRRRLPEPAIRRAIRDGWCKSIRRFHRLRPRQKAVLQARRTILLRSRRQGVVNSEPSAHVFMRLKSISDTPSSSMKAPPAPQTPVIKQKRSVLGRSPLGSCHCLVRLDFQQSQCFAAYLFQKAHEALFFIHHVPRNMPDAASAPAPRTPLECGSRV